LTEKRGKVNYKFLIHKGFVQFFCFVKLLL